ncbi:MAG: response regulator [Gemmatimonadota bacterium]|nr:response regulator [Gemmatimonadota bacterium]
MADVSDHSIENDLAQPRSSTPAPSAGEGVPDIARLRHELNNPLAALMLNLEMLKEGGHDDADELLAGIEIAARRIAAIIRRLEGLKTPQRILAIGGDSMADLSADQAAPFEARTILLVDDEESVRAIVTKILTRHGHKVLEAEHGAAALRAAGEYDGKIDLLVTDMYMPGLRGPEILEKLRPSRPGMRVLYMSGYGDEDVARSGVEPGSSFLRKPFTVQELSEAVQKSLAGPA